MTLPDTAPLDIVGMQTRLLACNDVAAVLLLTTDNFFYRQADAKDQLPLITLERATYMTRRVSNTGTTSRGMIHAVITVHAQDTKNSDLETIAQNICDQIIDGSTTEGLYILSCTAGIISEPGAGFWAATNNDQVESAPPARTVTLDIEWGDP